jgi:hypothetical protein
MKPENETGIDALIVEFYRAFDNRGGRTPSADALRKLFAPGARIMRVSSGANEQWTVDEFIAPRIAMLTNGTLAEFHEWEVQGSTTVFENIASRESHYRKTGTLNGAPYSGGGRKFIGLSRVNAAWLICSILWEDDLG